ncbi:MAG: AAA family ATPase [Desulfobacterales bacterium]|jgi:type II secretory pathway predicted ATPase ExeA
MNATDNIKNHFGLSKIPFSKAIGVNELFQGSSFKEACVRLEIALENEDIALLTGDVGSGKSNVLRFFTHNLDPQAYKTVYIPADNFKIGEIAKRALSGLNVEIPYQAASALRKLKQSIISLNHNKGIKPIMIIDEIQDLPATTLISLKNISNYNMDSENLLFIILCGQKSITKTLRLDSLESLSRRIRVKYSLKGLDLEETSRYITHQLKICGLEQNIFTDDTKAEIFNHSKGIISAINAVCFGLIIYAVAHSKNIIEPSMLEVVLQNKDCE